MKNFNSILNVVLAIAVAVLFYFHFASSKKKSATSTAKASCAKGCVIAYFEMDSIQNHFEYYKEIIKDLSKKEQAVRNVLALKKNANISKLKEYQGKGSSMSQDQMAQAQQDLQNRDREYQLDEQTEANKLSQMN